MFNRILVPLDGSAAAEGAVAAAAALARAHGAELHLVLVTELSRVDPLYDEQLENEHCTYRDERMQPLARTLREDLGLAVTTARLSGVHAPATAIADYVSKTETDLVVMATHGRTGWRRAMAGSVADDLVHRTATPVLLLRVDAPVAPLHRIMVALDGSEGAEAALIPVRALGRVNRSLVILARVVAPVAIDVPADQLPGVLLTDADATQAEVDRAHEYLDAVAQQLREREGLQVETIVEVAEPAFPVSPVAAVVAELARSTRADLVALTTHSRNNSRMLRRSVSDRILHDTQCALLICHPQVGAFRSSALTGQPAGAVA